MKNLVLLMMMLIAIPATAQHGLFESHSRRASHAPARHRHESMMHRGDHRGRAPQVYCMNDADFEAALRVLSKETFDSGRLDVAKSIARGNWLSARQIAAICTLFTYDSNRVEFAKFAYGACIDKGMYFLVDETFTYNSSKEEVREFIKNR